MNFAVLSQKKLRSLKVDGGSGLYFLSFKKKTKLVAGMVGF